MTVDFSKVVLADDFVGEDDEDEAGVRRAIKLARGYLSGFDWCDEIVELYVGDVTVGDKVAVLLARIRPRRPDVDEWLWVVVGDIPPAYLVTDGAPSPAVALDRYVGAMREWVEAVRAGRPVDDLIPVETAGGGSPLATTEETAEMLASRLDFIDERILPKYEGDLDAD